MAMKVLFSPERQPDHLQLPSFGKALFFTSPTSVHERRTRVSFDSSTAAKREAGNTQDPTARFANIAIPACDAPSVDFLDQLGPTRDVDICGFCDDVANSMWP
jgi:hypothetical protein